METQTGERRGHFGRLRALLPQGTSLEERDWETRHRFIVAFGISHAVGLAAFGLMMGWGPAYSLGEGALIALISAAAIPKRLGRRFRSATAAFAAVTSSAVLTQFSGGFIEAHFHFFVVVALIALYQDWVPFLLAIAYVALDHGVVGTLAPQWVYNHPDAIAHPWKWAAIHAVLVLAESVALMILWKSAETAEQRALDKQIELERIRRREEFKSHLLTTMSHELKTPLTPLRLQLDMLHGGRIGPLNDRQQRAITILSRNLTRLSALVDQTLDVGRLEAGRITLSRRDVDAHDVAKEVVDAFEHTAAEKRVALEIDVPHGLPMHADPHRITQVVYNLLSNAVKFTPPGGRVVVRARKGADGVTVSVQDSGDGIPAERLPALFQAFSQVHDTMQRTEAGSGLGLFICKGILDLHGGRIWATSSGPGHGSTFWFWLPGSTANAPA